MIEPYEHDYLGGSWSPVKTHCFHQWLKNQDDKVKQFFAINHRIPHTWFNCACRFFPSSQLQGIDWYTIFKSGDLGNWSHGGKVNVIGKTAGD